MVHTEAAFSCTSSNLVFVDIDNHLPPGTPLLERGSDDGEYWPRGHSRRAIAVAGCGADRRLPWDYGDGAPILGWRIWRAMAAADCALVSMAATVILMPAP